MPAVTGIYIHPWWQLLSLQSLAFNTNPESCVPLLGNQRIWSEKPPLAGVFQCPMINYMFLVVPLTAFPVSKKLTVFKFRNK